MEPRFGDSSGFSAAAAAGTEVMRFAVNCDVDAPGLARKAFDAVAGIDDVREDARLVVTELVSNAVRHSGCAASDLIQVLARLRDGVLEVAVTDLGVSRSTPRLRLHQVDGGGGLGLRIVASVSIRWGTMRAEDNCRTVWADLATSHAG